MFWRGKRVDPDRIEDSAKLDALREILFPRLVTETRAGETYHVDRSVDANLNAVLLDMQDGLVDDITENTVRDVMRALVKARDILVRESDIPEGATYLVVAPPCDGLTDDL